MKIELALPIRTYDIDFAGIVSNIVYVRWLEDLRLAMLAQHFRPLPEILLTGIAPVLIKTDISYKQQLTIYDRAIGKMWIEDMGSLRCTLAAEIVSGEDESPSLAVQAQQTVIFIDLSTRRPVRIPPDFLAQ